MTDRAAVATWVEQYERAWRTAGTEPLAALFTDDATYSLEPYDEPVRGLAAIAELWEQERTGADEVFTMRWEFVAVEGATAVVRVEVEYPEKQLEYRDLWVMDFGADGRCRSFAEWPFWPEKGNSETPSPSK
jgi:ketosteroid isomerase-like protein